MYNWQPQTRFHQYSLALPKLNWADHLSSTLVPVSGDKLTNTEPSCTCFYHFSSVLFFNWKKTQTISKSVFTNFYFFFILIFLTRKCPLPDPVRLGESKLARYMAKWYDQFDHVLTWQCSVSAYNGRIERQIKKCYLYSCSCTCFRI